LACFAQNYAHNYAPRLETAAHRGRIVQVMRISLELDPADGDRLEGRVVTGDGRADLSFSGTLDLLRVLEQLRHADAADAADAAAAPTATASPSTEEPSPC